MLRRMIKIILFPVIVLFTFFEYICSVAVGLSSIIFRLIGGVFILFAFMSYGFRLESWTDTMKMILSGIVFLAIPAVGTVLNAGFVLIRTYIQTI